MPKSDSKVIRDMHEDVKEILEKFHALDKKVAVIEVKASIWGTLGGMIAGCAALFLPHRV